MEDVRDFSWVSAKAAHVVLLHKMKRGFSVAIYSRMARYSIESGWQIPKSTLVDTCVIGVNIQICKGSHTYRAQKGT